MQAFPLRRGEPWPGARPPNGATVPASADGEDRSRRSRTECASWPVSRVLYGGRKRPRGSHSSGMPVAGHLVQPTRAAGAETRWSCCQPVQPLFGLAPGGVYPAMSVAGHAVRSYRTFSPLPRRARRFVFCGTFPEVALAGRYPAPCLRGARTFLPCRHGRPPGQLAQGTKRISAHSVKPPRRCVPDRQRAGRSRRSRDMS